MAFFTDEERKESFSIIYPFFYFWRINGFINRNKY